MLNQLVTQIIAGKRLTPEDDLTILFTVDINELRHAADQIRRHFLNDQAELCTIVNGRGGKCSEDCKFCAQSAHYSTPFVPHPFLPADEILSDALRVEEKGISRYSIVTAGRSLSTDELEFIAACYHDLHKKTSLELCASHGLLDKYAFQRLKESGVTRYHCNLETSRRNFPNICTTHTYDQKIETIRLAQEAGLSICSGGIFGISETMQDRLDMAFELQKLKVDSIPLNLLTPIPGTPFADAVLLPEETFLRTIAIFRFICPQASIRLAAGRTYLTDYGKLAFSGGADAAISGDMLTTTGCDIASDKKLLTSLHYQL